MLSTFSLLGLLFAAACPGVGASQSAKRGLVFVPNSMWPQDNSIWTQQGSGLSWYYNFGWNVSEAYANLSSSTIEFVPMMWGASNDTTFVTNITGLVEQGHNISHILSFSEPDASWSDGGSNMTPSAAADVWVKNLVPLQEKGIKIGLPIVKAQDDPLPWLEPFVGNCSALLKKNCSFDFMAIHSYGNFDSLKKRVDIFSAAFPNTPIWITEYGYDHQDLNTTQVFFNQSLSYLDSTDIIERYSFFGAFRSVVSNVGYNMAFLDPNGNLTDIGSWYLGNNATGKAPMPSFSGSTNTSCNSTNPCGSKNTGNTARGLDLGWLAIFGLLALAL